MRKLKATRSLQRRLLPIDNCSGFLPRTFHLSLPPVLACWVLWDRRGEPLASLLRKMFHFSQKAALWGRLVARSWALIALALSARRPTVPGPQSTVLGTELPRPALTV